MTEPFLTADQLAKRWGVKPATLSGQRSRGSGPPYYIKPKFGLPSGSPRVCYPLAQILAFEQANNITPLNP